ncbi:MAG: amino acid adenylation domain-containing protein [Aestuariibacter sp.]
MSISSLISQLNAQGIMLWQESGELKLKAPKGRLTPELREQLVENKPAIISFLQLLESNMKQPAIRRTERSADNVLPLSYAQERLWFLQQLEPDGFGYHVPGAVRVQGELDIDALEQAFNKVIARHESLRTVFISELGKPRQKILPELHIKFARDDISVSADSEQQLSCLCHQDATKTFDLARGPLLRGRVVRIAEDEHVVIFILHHIISDGWSLGVLINELSLSIAGQELPELAIQYGDYSVWQRHWLEDKGVLAKQLDYWQGKLEGVTQSIEIHSDFPRGKERDYAGGELHFSLDKTLHTELQSVADMHNCTIYMLLVAAIKVLLYRYSGQTDICVGSPIANRQYAETEPLIGMFVNTLALRDELQPDCAFTDLLQQVRQTCLEAYEHQDAPFEKIVDIVQPERNMALNPLFQVMVILQNTPSDDLSSQFSMYPMQSGVSKFDLTFEFSETQDGLSCRVEYSSGLYLHSSIERLSRNFHHLCRSIATAPQTDISRLNYLPDAERQLVLENFNQTPGAALQDSCIHELFIQQALATPERIAVRYEQAYLTYGELLERSGLLAGYLQQQGVGADTLVGICMPRDEQLLVAILAILRAGGAYVPLDPNYPEGRLQHIHDDSRINLLLTRESLLDLCRIISRGESSVLCLDKDWQKISGSEGNQPLKNIATPQNLAYIIYTSGSTGKPKGVAIEHRNAGALLHWAAGQYAAEEYQGMMAATSMCFDLSIFEMFLPLSKGGEVIMMTNALSLATSVNRQRVTLVNTVPSAAEELLAQQAIPDSVVTINLAGEPLSSSLVDKLYDGCKVNQVYDLYGPSEDTTYSTFMPRAYGAPECIGRPLSNTRAYVLDCHGEPVGIGVAGELYLAGAGVARGYLYRPEPSAEKFTEDPFFPGSRLYRTGDLVLWNPDGTLKYLGRIDNQFKLRGFRIEVREIEARLANLDEVQEAVVVVQGEGRSKRLVAFVVLEDEYELDGRRLKAQLADFLPDYMLPSAWQAIDEVPLTPNGKIDRKQLSETEVAIQSEQEYVAPETEQESKLVNIWSQILALPEEQISVQESFFDLGGNSLSAVQLMAKINQQFERLLPLATLLKAPTIRALTNHMSSGEDQAIDTLITLQAEGPGIPLFAVPGGGGNVFSLQPLADATKNLFPFHALQASGLDGVTLPFQSVEDAAQNYVEVIQQTYPEGPYRLLGMSYGGPVVYEIAKQLQESGARVEQIVFLDSIAPRQRQTLQSQVEPDSIVEVCRVMAELNDIKVDIDPTDYAGLSVETQCEKATALFQSQGVEIELEQFLILFKVYLQHDENYLKYKPAVMPSPVTVKVAKAMHNQYLDLLENDYGWQELFQSQVQVAEFAADHYSIAEAPHTHGVIELVNRQIVEQSA